MPFYLVVLTNNNSLSKKETDWLKKHSFKLPEDRFIDSCPDCEIYFKGDLQSCNDFIATAPTGLQKQFETIQAPRHHD